MTLRIRTLISTPTPPPKKVCIFLEANRLLTSSKKEKNLFWTGLWGVLVKWWLSVLSPKGQTKLRNSDILSNVYQVSKTLLPIHVSMGQGIFVQVPPISKYEGSRSSEHREIPFTWECTKCMANYRMNLTGKELDQCNRKVKGLLNLSFINAVLFYMLNQNQTWCACLLLGG